MVCATTERSATITGGFIPVGIPALLGAWHACRARPLGTGDFRTLLACREMVARRRHVHRDRSPAYGFAEVAKLCGVSSRTARASVRRLVVAGLLEWSEEAIGFPDQSLEVQDLVSDLLIRNLEQVRDTIGRGRGTVLIPRRLLRHLADGAAPAVIATALGFLLRCLSRRRDGYRSRGRVKASWISEVFGVELRRVKAARRRLIAAGWIEAEAPDQRSMNRWGRAYRIDLQWAPPTGSRRKDTPSGRNRRKKDTP